MSFIRSKNTSKPGREENVEMSPSKYNIEEIKPSLAVRIGQNH
jgi:hypothetical protein